MFSRNSAAKISGLINDGTEKTFPLVAILVDADLDWKRNLVRGIMHYSALAGWEVIVLPMRTSMQSWMLQAADFDGVIAAIESAEQAEFVKSLGGPVVDVLGGNIFDDEFPSVTTDPMALCAMAFGHFRERMFENYACLSGAESASDLCVSETFAKVVRSAGYNCSLRSVAGKQNAVESRNDGLRQWLHDLPKPVAMFVHDASLARALTVSVPALGQRIPDDVSILASEELWDSVDLHDGVVSSVVRSGQQIGRRACEMLVEVMAGRGLSQYQVRVPPLGIKAHRSTEHVAIVDRKVADMVHLIWKLCGEGIQVPDLVKHSDMSRRALEHRFQRVLGHSPAEAIRRAKIEKARQMVLLTTKTISAIASASGFATGPYLTQVFRKYYRVTPSELRKIHGVSNDGRPTSTGE